MTSIDINFNVFSDTPKGKDPDSYSPRLRMYHQKLWSKKLPNGMSFDHSLLLSRYCDLNTKINTFIFITDHYVLYCNEFKSAIFNTL